MPVNFQLPPDTRAVGSGNPPADVNAHTDALAAMGATFNVLNAVYAGGADPTGAADSSAAFAAAIAAAVPVNGEVVIPPGAYNCNTGNITITGPVRIRGLGVGVANNLTSPSANPQPAVTINCNGNGGSAPLFPLGNSYTGLWGGLEMQGIAVNYTGAGTVFPQFSVCDAIFRDCTVTLTAAGSMVMSLSGVQPSWLNITHERCNFNTYAAVRTNPMFSITSNASGAISNNTFFRCKFSNWGFDSTQYMVHVACTGAGGAYHMDEVFRECWFEHPYGGAVRSLSGQNVLLDSCFAWDLFSGGGPNTTVAAGSNGGTISGIASWANPSPGVLAVASTAGFPPLGGTLNVVTSGTAAVITYTGITGSTFTGCAFTSGTGTVATGAAVTFPVSVGNSLYYFGAAPGNSGSQGTTISNCGRNRDGPNGSTTWDVYAEATSSQTLIQGYVIKPSTPSSTNNAFFNFNSHTDVTLINNQSPQGSAVNGNSTTVVTNPSPLQVTIGNGTVTASTILGGGSWAPQDSGWLEFNYDPAACGAYTPLATSGTVNLIRVPVRTARSITNVIVWLGTLGATLTAGQNFAGLYTSAGVLIGTSANQTATWNTGGTTGLQTIPLTGGPFTVQPGFVWVALLFNGTTGPAFAQQRNFAVGITNAGTGNATCRWGTATAAQTSLPGSFTPSSNTSAQVAYWAALS